MARRALDMRKSSKSKDKRDYRKWLVGAVLVPIGLVLLSKLPWDRFFSTDTPKFALAKPVTRPESGLTILALNSQANENKALDIEFDGSRFRAAGVPITGHTEMRWHVDLLQLGLPPHMLADGRYRLRLGFDGAFSDTLLVTLNTRAPVVEAEIEQVPGRPDDRRIQGRVASHAQTPAETLAVDVFFHSEGQMLRVPLPVKRVTDEQTGITAFTFETFIEDLPRIPPDDPRYSDDFFAFRVTDGAGNSYHQVESYARFVAPGGVRFGVGSVADIEVTRLPEDVQRQRIAVTLTPLQQPITHLPDGRPVLSLVVTAVAGNVNELRWSQLPPELRPVPPVTAIYRNEEPLTISFSNRYRDENVLPQPAPVYQVQQIGRDGQLYASNTAKPGPRSQAMPLTDAGGSVLTEERVKQMLRERGFFNIDWHKEGKGIAHQYELRADGQVLYDGATGLTWQQSASDESMVYKDAQAYIKKLNDERFAGHDTWRLPTLEEAMSLMEPKKHGDLYLDPVFDQKQRWIWTADKHPGGSIWVVTFLHGHCYYDFTTFSNYYVRAVF